MSYPYCYSGQLWPFLMIWRWNNNNQPALACLIDVFGASDCPMAAFSGFYESPGPPLLVNALGIVLPHCNDHRNGQQSWCILHCRFVDCFHWLCVAVAWHAFSHEYVCSLYQMCASFTKWYLYETCIKFVQTSTMHLCCQFFYNSDTFSTKSMISYVGPYNVSALSIFL